MIFLKEGGKMFYHLFFRLNCNKTIFLRENNSMLKIKMKVMRNRNSMGN